MHLRRERKIFYSEARVCGEIEKRASSVDNAREQSGIKKKKEREDRRGEIEKKVPFALRRELHGRANGNG